MEGDNFHAWSTGICRKMSWFGHIIRSTGLANTIMQGMVDGRRRRGRPRISWLDNIKCWTGLTFKGIHSLSKDRKKWRSVLRIASQMKGLLLKYCGKGERAG